MNLSNIIEMLKQIDCNGGTMVVLLFIVGSLIQVSPLKINPWTWLGNTIRSWLGINDIKEDMMDARRTRIIQFDDELMNDEWHRKDMFDAVLIDCDKYEKYCLSHKGYVNSIAGDAIQHIKETYHEQKEKGGFLVRKKVNRK